MKVLQDYHCHTAFSFDGSSSYEDVLAAASREGITHLAFTDHADFDKNKPSKQCFEELKTTFEQAFHAFQTVQKPDGMNISFGIEIGQPLFSPKESVELAHAFPFDVVLMSVHEIWDYPDFFFFDYSSSELQEAIRKYFADVLTSVQMADFDVLAHLTYPYRYLSQAGVNLPIEQYAAYTDEIFRILINRQKALEINVSTMYQGYEPMPCRQLMKRYHELGGRFITIGTDDHKLIYQKDLPQKGIDVAKEAGFDSFMIFHGRKMSEIHFS